MSFVALGALFVLLIGGYAAYRSATRYDKEPLRRLEADPMVTYSPPQATGSAVTSRRDHLARVPWCDSCDESPSEIEARIVQRIDLGPTADVDRFVAARRAIITEAGQSGWRSPSTARDRLALWTGRKVIDGMPATLLVYPGSYSWEARHPFTQSDLARMLRDDPAIRIELAELSAGDVDTEKQQKRWSAASSAGADSALDTLSAEVRRVAAPIRSSDGSPRAIRRIGSAATSARDKLIASRSRPIGPGHSPAHLTADQLTLLQINELTFLVRAAQAEDPHDAAKSIEAARAFVPAQRGLTRDARNRGIDAPRTADHGGVPDRAFASKLRGSSPATADQRYELAMTAILAEHQAQLGLASGRDILYGRSLGQAPRSKLHLRATARRMRLDAAPPPGAAILHRRIVAALDEAARADDAARRNEAAQRRAEAEGFDFRGPGSDGRRGDRILFYEMLKRVDDLVAQLKARGYAIGVDRTAIQLQSGSRPPNPRYPEVHPP